MSYDNSKYTFIYEEPSLGHVLDDIKVTMSFQTDDTREIVSQLAYFLMSNSVPIDGIADALRNVADELSPKEKKGFNPLGGRDRD